MASFVHLIDQRRLIGPGGSTTSGEIYFYYTGTTVKAPIFSDAALLIPLSNPVVVGAGSIIPLIFLNDSIQYRRVIQYADGSIDEQDPIGNLFSDGDIGLPVGSVIDYSGESPPSGFLFCFGQEISRSDYSELFDTIGTQYGPGNGSTTFNLPDYRGRVGAGKDNMGGSAAGRLATQLTGSVLGAVGGAEGHVLTIAQLAAHAHNITITDPGHTHGIPVYGDGNSGNFIEDAGGGTLKTVTSNSATTGITATSANQGSSEAHNNVQPTIVINKIIKTSSVSFLSLFGINLAEEAASAVASIQLAGAAVQAGIENYYGTIAEGVANTPVGDYFASPETGTVRIYLRTVNTPYYQDQGDSVAPVTRQQLSISEANAASSASIATIQAAAVAAAMNSSNAPYANAYASSLPKGVTSTTITAAGTGGTSGTYALGVSGGPTGFAGTYTISGGGVTAITITNPGLSTATTAPTLSFPSGSVTGATATATVGTLVLDQKTYWVASANSSQILLYGNNGGSVATAPFGGTQLVLYSKTGVDSAVSTVTSVFSVVETDAFTFTYLDKDGFLISLLDNSFLWQGPNQTYLTDLISHTTIETDAFVYCLIDKDGFLVDYHNGTAWNSVSTYLTATVDPTLYIPVGSYLTAVIYGQSVFTGAGTTALSTSAYSGGGLKMFNGGTQLGANYSNPTYTASLVNCVEGVSSGVEDAARGVGEGFAQFFNSEAGYAFTDDGVNLILSVPAEGGKSASELSNGGAYFPRLQYIVDAINTIAKNANEVPDVVHLVYCQGEQDINNGTDPTVWYNQIENGIRLPFEAYCQSKFGRKTKVKVIMTQVASHQYYGFTDPNIARKVLDICNTNDNYEFAGAMYQYNYGAGGVGSHLLNATEVKWAAAMAGRVLQRAARGATNKWINPLRAWQEDLRTVVIEYDVPVGPLVIDTTNVSDPGQKGFNLYSDSTEIAISNVAISGLGRKTVRLTTSTDIPTGGILRVDYAHKGGATGVYAGRNTGSRGCLRDSDPSVFDPSGINKPLYNWAPIHRIYLG